MLETFTLDTFTPLLQDSFQVSQAAPDFAFNLIEASELKDTGPADPRTEQHRTPFSLVFRGPRAPILAQQTVRLEHATLGAFELFIVPIGVDAAGARYEAVFV